VAQITCKFGGSSLADAECIRVMEAIVRENPDRRFIVPSAPGKRTPDDRKITDLLYAWHNMAKEGFDASEPRGIIADRFLDLAKALGVRFDIQKHLDEIADTVSQYATPDYMASRGEYLNGRLIAELLGATFVDPAECILFTESGHFNPASYETLGARLKGDGIFVVPGFYGALPGGTIKTFSRGGSDITGSIVARASESDLYENWTDVSGFRMADPRIVPDARRIGEITYQELRELSYMGASVLHDEAIFPVRDTGIPIHIRNTKDRKAPGTKIVSERKATSPVVGVAGRSGFTMINIEKTFMNKEKGFGLRVLQVLEEHGMSWEHMPTGIDTISLIISDEQLGNLSEDIMRAIEKRCDTDRIGMSRGLAIIATVGQGMNHHVGVAARLFSAIAEAGVNLQVIDQGSSEMNIIIGVEEKDLGTAVNAIYRAFENQE
jgi:aspartate kinase